MNRLGESLNVYESIVQEHPNDAFAKYSMAFLMSDLQRYEDALLLLPEENPISVQDFIGYRMRGIVFLKSRKIDSALNVFREAIEHDPRPLSQDHSKLLLSVALNQKNNNDESFEVLDSLVTQQVQVPATVLKIYGKIAGSDIDGIALELNDLSKNLSVAYKNLIDCFNEQSLRAQGSSPNNEQLLEEIVDYCYEEFLSLKAA